MIDARSDRAKMDGKLLTLEVGALAPKRSVLSTHWASRVVKRSLCASRCLKLLLVVPMLFILLTRVRCGLTVMI